MEELYKSLYLKFINRILFKNSKRGFISELFDLLGKLKFFKIVDEWEQGLYLRNGLVLEKRIKKLKPELEQKLEQEEKQTYEASGSLWDYLHFGLAPYLPKGYRWNFVTGKHLHPKRYSKILSPGLYFHLPFIERIVTDSKQERVLNLDEIVIPTKDEEPRAVVLSCNIRYEVMDLYRAFTAVHDYETSLKDHTLSILADAGYGNSYSAYWQDAKNVGDLEDRTEEELRKIVTEKWGLKIHKIYITDVAPCTVIRQFLKGNQAVNLINRNYVESE